MTNWWQNIFPLSMSDWKQTYYQVATGMSAPFDMPPPNVFASHMRIRIEREAGSPSFLVTVDGTDIASGVFAPFGGVFDVEYCYTSSGWQQIGGPGIAYCDETNATNAKVGRIHFEQRGGFKKVEVWLSARPTPEIPALTFDSFRINGQDVVENTSVDTGSQDIQFDVHINETKGVASSVRLALFDDNNVLYKVSEPKGLQAFNSDWFNLTANVRTSGYYQIVAQALVGSDWVTVQTIRFHLNVTSTGLCIPEGRIKGSGTCCEGSVPCGAKGVCTKSVDGCCSGQKMCDGSCITATEKCSSETQTPPHYVCDNGTCRAVVCASPPCKDECTPTGSECKKCALQFGTTCISTEMLAIGLILIGAVVVIGK